VTHSTHVARVITTLTVILPQSLILAVNHAIQPSVMNAMEIQIIVLNVQTA